MSEFYLIAPEKHFYELGTLIREYFPLVKIISEKKEGIPGIELSDDERCARYTDPDGKTQEVTIPDDFDEYRGEKSKNLAKRAIRSVLGEELAWGILTGVRPTKVAYSYLEDGKSPEEVEKILRDYYGLRKDKAALTSQVAVSERKILMDHTGEDVSVYAGVLFCPTRCSYCSFISNDIHAYDRYHEAYVDAMIREMEETKEILQGRRVRSFYMGGGTPTTLSAEELKRVLTKMDEILDFSKLDEVCVEAGRPDTITKEKLKVLKECKVDRISINPQTMNQKTLDLIGRKHTVEAIDEAFLMAREAGFDNINMDLIVGLPEEGPEDVRRTMERVRRLDPENVTVHTLAVKRASRMNEFGEGEKLLMSEQKKLTDMIDEMITITRDVCLDMGLQPYYMYRQKNMAGNFENVGYARPGFEGRYNIEIMEERQSILAYGGGAVSKMYVPEEDRLERIPNVKGVKEYIERIDEMIERKKGGFLR